MCVCVIDLNKYCVYVCVCDWYEQVLCVYDSPEYVLCDPRARVCVCDWYEQVLCVCMIRLNTCCVCDPRLLLPLVYALLNISQRPECHRNMTRLWPTGARVSMCVCVCVCVCVCAYVCM